MLSKKLKYIPLIIIPIITTCTQHKEVVTEKYKNGKTKVTQTVISIHGNDTLKKITGYRENEKLSFVGFQVNDKLDSVFTQWHTNSYQISERINYSHGKKNGLSAGWFIDGKKSYEVNYVDDFKNGTETTWYANGNMKSEGNFEDGKNVELWTYWYENGNKKEEGSYKGGEFKNNSLLNSNSAPEYEPWKDGRWTYWYDDGTIIKTEYWKEGNLKDN